MTTQDEYDRFAELILRSRQDANDVSEQSMDRWGGPLTGIAYIQQIRSTLGHLVQRDSADFELVDDYVDLGKIHVALARTGRSHIMKSYTARSKESTPMVGEQLEMELGIETPVNDDEITLIFYRLGADALMLWSANAIQLDVPGETGTKFEETSELEVVGVYPYDPFHGGGGPGVFNQDDGDPFNDINLDTDTDDRGDQRSA